MRDTKSVIARRAAGSAKFFGKPLQIHQLEAPLLDGQLESLRNKVRSISRL
ncbi:MAG TPA: hypothetical protein VJV04_09360 [Nitrospiraceae bacterium]|nr:hypothetical protein [Nitrospiraceae bacterium]